MLVSYNWLKEFGEMPEDINEFKFLMTLTGTMVESVTYLGEGIENVITAKVIDVTPHPDSDHMTICKVDTGKDIRTVVTGAPNIAVGIITPYAQNNSKLPGGIEIKTTKLRGIESEGMLCSAQELGIPSSLVPKNSEHGIYIFTEEVPLGMDIKEAMGLDDYVIEFELTNNRQDCNSIIGIASESEASLQRRFEMPDYSINDKTNEVEKILKVEIEAKDVCPRYCARVLKVKEVKPSPLWMQKKLIAGGMRPISNIVDVSNYVMMEIGQPLHMFDYDTLEGNKIIIKKANGGEDFTTLDNITRKLEKDMLLICDANKPVCIAGVMGGLNSEITDNTKQIVIESANFNKNSLRRTSKLFGLRSEAVAHYEKGISPSLCRMAVDRAASLLVEIGACELVEGVLDEGNYKEEQKEITLSANWVNSLLGTKIAPKDMLMYLNNLNIKTVADNDTLTCTIPALRQDLNIKEDIAEEVARMYGYNNIPMTMLENSSYISLPNDYYAKKNQLKNVLIGIGGYEILTYSFFSPSEHERFRFNKEDKRSKTPIVRNPLGEDTSVMRTTMLNGLLSSIALNVNKKNENKLLFEIGNVFFDDGKMENGLPSQEEMLCFGKNACDYFELKGVAEYVLNFLKIKNVTFEKANEPFLHPGRSAVIKSDEKQIGFIGELHPKTAGAYGLKSKVYVCQMNIKQLFALSNNKITFKTINKFPSLERDMALVVNKELYAGEIENKVKEMNVPDLISIKPFDVYTGDQVAEDKKSIAFNLVFQGKDRTLTDEEVDNTMKEILNCLNKTFDAVLR